MYRSPSPILVALVLAVVVASCSSSQGDSDEAATTTSSTASEGGASAETDRIVGMFDVGGGVELYMECDGTGSPTIVYLHGSVENRATSPVASAAPSIRNSLTGDYRFCAYNRRNVGPSTTVEGYFTGTTAIEDLHGLMNAAGIEPPYVLLAASFGGIIAHLYAAAHPDEVVGIVSLDGSVPGDITLDAVLPDDMRYKPDDDRSSVEKLSHYAALHEALDATPPDIPFHYLLATPSEWPTLGVPAYDEAILDVVADYAASFPQGKLIEVESPHFMEPAVPDTIVEHLIQVIQEAGY